MKQVFNYMYTQSSMDELEVEDIGNVIIEANNDLGQFWLIWISTQFGYCYIVEYGPYYKNNKQTDYLYQKFEKIEYSEYKLEKKIDKFLNDPKRFITQVDFIDEDTARNIICSVVETRDESYQ